jgi:hypothetical protein
LEETSSKTMLDTYKTILDAEYNRVGDGCVSISHIDTLVRIFFIIAPPKLETLFHIKKEGSKSPINVLSDEGYSISRIFWNVSKYKEKRRVLQDGYRRLLPIVKQNEGFKSVASKIKQLEDIINKEGFVCYRRVFAVRDIFYRMVKKIAGVKEHVLK